MFILLLSCSAEFGVTRSVCYEDGGAMPYAFIKRIHLRINNMFKPKTLSEIFKNSVNPYSESSVRGKYYIETCRGKDDACIVSTMIFLKNLIPIRA